MLELVKIVIKGRYVFKTCMEYIMITSIVCLPFYPVKDMLDCNLDTSIFEYCKLMEFIITAYCFLYAKLVQDLSKCCSKYL